MKQRNVFFVLFILSLSFVGCHSVEIKSYIKHQSVVKEWLNKGIKLKKQRNLFVSGETLNITFEEEAETGSPVLEKILAANLVNKLYNLDTTAFDSINIRFYLPKGIAKLSSSDTSSAFIKEYSFPKGKMAEISRKLSNDVANSVSDYIVYNVSNVDDVDLLAANNSAKKYIKWYKHEGSSLALIHKYTLEKNSENPNKQELKMMEFHILAVLKSMKRAKIGAVRHIDTILKMNRTNLPNYSLEELVHLDSLPL